MNLILMILIGTQSFAGGGETRDRIKDPETLPKRTEEYWGALAVLPSDVLDYINLFLTQRALGALASTNTTYGAYRRHLRGVRVAQAIENREFKNGFLESFVTIPEGYLPADATGHQPRVESFQTLKHPVTREIWDHFLKGTHEYETWWNTYVSREIKEDWSERQNVPVTYIVWEENKENKFAPAEVQFFFKRLNQWAAKYDRGCHYRASTDHENWYKRRADVTGLNRDEFSAGITMANVGEYVTHAGNSNPDGQGQRVQPVGMKKPNEFGIELGNVWEISSDIYIPDDPHLGRAVRGSSWDSRVDGADSNVRCLTFAGNRLDSRGFSIVRTCP